MHISNISLTRIFLSKKIIVLILFLSFFRVYSQPIITSSILNAPCNNDGILAIYISGMTPPYAIGYGYPSGTFQGVFHSNVASNSDTLKNIQNFSLPYYPQYISRSTQDIYIDIMDANGTTAGTIVAIPMPFTFTVNATSAICPALGSATVATSYNGPAFVEWGIGYYLPNIFTPIAVGNPNNSLQPGYYDLRVTDTLTGCSVLTFSTCVVIQNQSGITFSTSATAANCSNGTANAFSPTGGIAPYTYQWSNGATTSSLSNLTAGYYSVRAIDSQGCYSDNGSYVQQVTTFTTNYTVANATCLQSDGSIMGFVTGGTSPYSFNWTSGSTNQFATGLSAGYYSAIIVDANGCSGSINYISVVSNSPINVTYTASPSSCSASSGSATITPIGGTLPYNIVWGTYPPVYGNSISNMPVGTYSFKVTDAAGCVKNGSVYIPPNSSISANISVINPVCPSITGALYSNVSGTNPPFTYLWNTGAVTHNISNVVAGNYTCIITDANQCSVTKTAGISLSSPINVSLNSVNSSCLFSSDGNVTANAYGGTAPYSYNWSNGQSGSSISALSSGDYYVYVSDANGCTGYGYTQISYNPNNTACYCTISGTVFNDLNSNCIKDIAEIGISNIQIHCSGFGYVYTDAYGYYSFKVPVGTYSITQTLNANYPLATCQNQMALINVSSIGSGCYHQVDFANTVLPIHDLKITTTSSTIPPLVGNTYKQKIIIENNGTVVESNIQLGYEHDGQLSYMGGSPSYLIQQNSVNYPNWYSGNSIPAINPNGNLSLDIDYLVPTNIPIGTQVSFYDTVAYAAPMVANWLADNTPWDNVNSYQTNVIAAYDPNYKDVNPKGISNQGYISHNDSILNYVVHFQNEGTYFAQNIIVVDTLDNDLNWESLNPGYSNHNYIVSISEDGVLKFKFNNIILPWKSQYGDEQSSGMFTYAIKTKRNLPIGTTFINGAAIYFDYNEPIITNKTINTIGNLSTDINSINRSDEYFNVFPNPAIEDVFVTCNQKMKTIELFNISGQILISKKINEKECHLNLRDLTNGIYFIRVTNDEGYCSVQKIIIAN